MRSNIQYSPRGILEILSTRRFQRGEISFPCSRSREKNPPTPRFSKYSAAIFYPQFLRDHAAIPRGGLSPDWESEVCPAYTVKLSPGSRGGLTPVWESEVYPADTVKDFTWFARWINSRLGVWRYQPAETRLSSVHQVYTDMWFISMHGTVPCRITG